MTAQYTCDAPRCRQPSELQYRGIRLCDRHWGYLCGVEDRQSRKHMLRLARRWGADIKETIC